MPFKTVKQQRYHLKHIWGENCDFNVENICFGVPEERLIPNSTLKYTSIPLYYSPSDGVYAHVYFNTPNPSVFSYGIQEQKNAVNSNVLDGYSMALHVYDAQNPTQEERVFMKLFNDIVEHCKNYLCSQECKEYTNMTLTKPQLEKIASAMYYKMITTVDSKGKKLSVRDDAHGPIFYPKLITRRHPNGEFELKTIFTEPDSTERTTTHLALEKYRCPCRAFAIIELQSIYIGGNGSTIRLQFKVKECEVAPIVNEVPSFLRPQQRIDE